MFGERTIKLSLTVLLATFAVVALSVQGCIFDPWPEPPGSENASGDTGSDLDSDSEDQDTDGEGDFNQNLIYCSAPSPSGEVTVVGVEDAIIGWNSVFVEASSGDEASFDVQDDGSFAGRIQAQAGEEIYVTPNDGAEAPGPITIYAGILEGDPIGDTIVDPATVPAPNGEGLVVIHGGGEWLEENVIVVGGNIDLSGGSLGVTECEWGDCMFDITLEAVTGDDLDLFLVRDDENSGHSDSQTVVVPSS